MVAVVAGVGVGVVAGTKVGASVVGGCSAVLRGALAVVVGPGPEQRDCATAVHGRLSPRWPVVRGHIASHTWGQRPGRQV